jgi:hypothetical protein
MSWVILWAIVFYGSVGSFAIVSALVAIGGFREVRELFRAFAAKTREPE